jgi:alcohol dehydrogenase YqhD (iron-dependent ADH family)
VQNFLFTLPTRVVFGPGVIDSVGAEASACGAHALMVTGGAFTRSSGLIDHIRASLDRASVSVTIYDAIEPNPTVSAIDSGGEEARHVGADVILGLGGGSALDAAKAIAVVAACGRSIWDFTRDGAASGSSPFEALPIIQVPIIASTGSETNNQAIVLNGEERIKAQIGGDKLYARVAIIDPTLTFTVPARYTAVGAMNIISRILETYLTSDEFAVTDRLAEGLMRVVLDSLPRALRRAEDLDARNNLSWAAALTSNVAMAGRGGAAPLSAMAHPLTATLGIDHGAAVSALWPSYMRYALSNRYRLPQIGRFKRYALLGRQIFGVHETDDEVAAETTVYRFTSWLRGLDMPTDLRQLGFDDLPITDLADQALRVSGSGNRLPGGLGAGDIEHIYDAALRPDPGR